MKMHLLFSIATLILFLCIPLRAPAEVESVLSVIPEDAAGVVYVHSLLGLNDEINALLAEMVPSNPPQEVIAKALADAFGAGFESLEELETLGFDMQKNFAVFFDSASPQAPSAAVHVKDVESVKQLIKTQSQIEDTATYNGMTYNTTGEAGGFVILDDVMVYSGSAKVCEKAIDTYKQATTPIATNADYRALKLDTTSGTNDLVAYFAMDRIVEANRPKLVEYLDEMKARMAEQAAANPQLVSGLETSRKLIDKGLWLLDGAKTLSLTVQLNGSDLHIFPFLKFKEDSEIQEYIRQPPVELTQLKYLPQTAFLNIGARVESEELLRYATNIKLFAGGQPNVDQAQVEKALQEYTAALTPLIESIGDEIAASVNFSESVMPDLLFIAKVTDAERLKAYMADDYLTFLKSMDALYQATGSKSAAFQDVTAGASETYNGVEIKSYILPHSDALFPKLPPEAEGIAPKQWNIYYAFKEGKLITSTSANAQPVKDALDRLGRTGIGFDQAVGYDKLIDAFSLKNNLFVGISPITAIKNLVQVAAKTDPNVGMMVMLLANIPETYSIGIAGQNRDGGVQGKLLISIGDFKELINMAASMRQQ